MHLQITFLIFVYQAILRPGEGGSFYQQLIGMIAVEDEKSPPPPEGGKVQSYPAGRDSYTHREFDLQREIIQVPLIGPTRRVF